MSHKEIIANNSNNSLMNFSNIDEATKWAKMISDSSVCPKNYKGKISDIIIAVHCGVEIGLKPLQALQGIAVINGKVALYGDMPLAMCKAHPSYEYIEETVIKNEEDGLIAICKVKRHGEPEHVKKYSEKMAKAAGLLNRTGPWQTDRERMLQMRARGFALRDVFPDVLGGLISSHEAQDYPTPHTEKVINEIPLTKQFDVDNETGEIVRVEEPIQNLINEETINEIYTLLGLNKISDKQLNKWLNAADARTVEELTQEKGNKFIVWLQKKLESEKTKIETQ